MSDTSLAYVLDLRDCTGSRTARVGGKGAGLGALIAAGHPVPPGFVITTDSYRASTSHGGFADRLDALTAGLDESTDNRAVSALIAELFLQSGPAAEVRADIVAAYHALGDDTPVAVRSSATAEDTEDASFAGQQDTYLWVRGADAVVEHVVRCWASLFTAQAIAYRHLVGVPTEQVEMAVVVQQMVDAAAAGVMMSLHPVTGDRNVVYLESAFGLGEAVVRGEVDADRFMITKKDLDVVERTIGHQTFAYRFVPASGTVERVECGPEGAGITLSDNEIAELSTLGIAIENQFGRPMDIEWAIGADRRIRLLQARPETVWSRRLTREQVEDALDRYDDWDPLHTQSEPHLHWATSNMGEAMPGIQTPLSWTVWAHGVEESPREAAYQTGALNRSERHAPTDPARRCLRVFYGRPAFNAEFLARIGNHMPGTTGQATVQSLLGRAPDSIDYTHRRHRYPIVAVRMPALFLRATGEIRRFAEQQDAWYRAQIPRIGTLDTEAATDLLGEAWDRHVKALRVQTCGIMGVMQPLYEVASAIARRFGGDATVLTGPPGGAEMAVVADIWAMSRSRLGLDEFLLRHGFHGPAEGELSSRIWREDPTPVHAMVEAYRAQDESHNPHRLDAERRRRYAAAERAVLEAAPRAARPALRLALRLIRTRLPLRGVAKRSFLQAFDVARGAARRLGDLYSAEGLLERPDDVFYLTFEELRSGLPSGARKLVARRRTRHAAYSEIELPPAWRGAPPVQYLDVRTAAPTEEGDLTGIGVSAGVVEGRARVLSTPDFAAVEPGEILIAPATDPSWSSVMFIAGGLVVDIGGALSHAAVVAREMGQPCVVNTRTGTKRISTGDLVRVDGTSGVVTIVEPIELSTERIS